MTLVLSQQLQAWLQVLTRLDFSRVKGSYLPETTAIGSLAHCHHSCGQQTFPTDECQFRIIKELEGERIRDKKACYEKLQGVLLTDLEELLTV